MTREERETIKRLIDAAKRARIAVTMVGLKRCSGCGAELEFWTIGCKICHGRHTAAMRKGYRLRMPVDKIVQTRALHCAEGRAKTNQANSVMRQGIAPPRPKPNGAQIAWNNRGLNGR